MPVLPAREQKDDQKKFLYFGLFTDLIFPLVLLLFFNLISFRLFLFLVIFRSLFQLSILFLESYKHFFTHARVRNNCISTQSHISRKCAHIHTRTCTQVNRASTQMHKQSREQHQHVFTPRKHKFYTCRNLLLKNILNKDSIEIRYQNFWREIFLFFFCR